MFGAGGHDIDPGGIDAAVAQDICQLCNILLNAIEGPGKKFAQVVGKDLGGIDLCRMAQPFHLRPNVASIQGGAVPGNEDSTALDTAFLRVIQ